MKVIDKALSSELHLILEVEEASLKVSLTYSGKLGSASLNGTLPVEALVDKLAASIPGSIDDLVLKGLLAAIK